MPDRFFYDFTFFYSVLYLTQTAMLEPAESIVNNTEKLFKK